LMIVGGTIGVASSFMNRSIVNTGGLMGSWTMALCIGLALFNKRLPIWLRGVLLTIAGLWVLWSFVMNISWVSGWLPGMVAGAVLLFMRDRKIFILSLLLVVGVFVLFQTYYTGRIKEEQSISGDTRVAAWEVNWKVTSEHLLFGTGPGGYAAYYMSYYPSEAMATHNNFIDILAETGLVGMAFWLWFLGALIWQAVRVVRRLRGRGDFYEGLANAILAGIVGCIVIGFFGDWLIPFAYTQTIAGFDYAVYSWIFMGAIVAIDNLVPATVEEPVVLVEANA
jgi:O-antigen ligase